MHDSQDDRWIEFRKRREEWRAARHARREAWRAARHARREAWARMWSGAYGFGPRGFGPVGARPNDMAEIKAQLTEMSKAISSLSERVAVLEKLALDEDRKLAAEIEKLRGKEHD